MPKGERLTSQDAYRKAILNGTKRGTRQKVYDFLKRYGDECWTRNEIAEETGIRLSTVCGAVDTLLKSDLIREVGETVDRHTAQNAMGLTIIRDAPEPKEYSFEQIQGRLPGT